MNKNIDYNFTTKKLSKSKLGQIDYLEESRKNSVAFAIGQVDVTEVREYFRTHRDEEGNPYSFTAYMAYLLAHAILEHPHINAYMLGRKKIVIFEDVDIVCIVERYFEGSDIPVPTSYTIRAAQKKHWKNIHNEIREAQARKAKGLQYDKKGTKQANRVKAFVNMPRWLRKIVLRRLMKNPHQKKQFMGTIGLTSVGMFMQQAGNPIGFTLHTVSFQVGGTDWQPRFNEKGELENRQFLSGCFAFDHAVIDGGPMARFVSTFRQMFQRGHGIDFSEPPNVLDKN